jgi:hypothetical protein
MSVLQCLGIGGGPPHDVLTSYSSINKRWGEALWVKGSPLGLTREVCALHAPQLD